MPTSLSDILKHYPEVHGIHPACLAVPEISSHDQAALNADIAKDGLWDEIVLTMDGQLIDGRNRLVACYLGNIEPRFCRTKCNPWDVAYSRNIARRHLQIGQLAIFGAKRKAWEAEQAKGRQIRKPAKSVPETLPEQTGDARDLAGKQVGVSGRSVDKAARILATAPDVAKRVSAGKITLEAGFKELKAREKQRAAIPAAESPQPTTDAAAMVTIVTAKGVSSKIPQPQKVVFNKTNDSVDWASWTWNPVTGCEHGCKFCYAREIAYSQRMADYYPNQFEPTYHAYRLDAPKNTKRPESNDARDGRVFVCSMADLFGKWVPAGWIRSVFAACQESPEWEYLFLTKWPARYSQMPLLKRAWYGASVIQQADVTRVEKAMQAFETDCVKWISLEPILQPIVFHDLSWCHLVVIGSQTSTTQPDGFVPAFAPEFDWVVDVVNQCREFKVPYYLKENLGLTAPGMKLPKGLPRQSAFML